MDEYESGMDPEIKKYFGKILNSFSFLLLWLLGISTAGIFFQLGFIRNGVKWYNIVFYLLFVISLGFLLRYLYRTWNKKN